MILLAVLFDFSFLRLAPPNALVFFLKLRSCVDESLSELADALDGDGGVVAGEQHDLVFDQVPDLALDGLLVSDVVRIDLLLQNFSELS